MNSVKKNMGRYLIGAMLGLSIGAVLYFVQLVQWKGQALVRIGQISQNQNQNQNQNSYSIEPMLTVVERIKSRSFLQAAAKRTNRKEVAVLLNSDDVGMAIKPTRNSDSLVLTVVGSSPELVRATVEAVVAELVSKHDIIINAYQADIKKELSKLDAEADILSKRIAAVTEGMSSNCKPSEGREAMAGFSIMTFQRDLEYKLNRASVLRESISSANIRPTSLIEPASISEWRMFSSLWRACLFGLLSGILLSAIWGRWGK